MSEHQKDTEENSPNEKARFLKQIVENIREIIWMFDATGNSVLYINPAYERIVGLTVDSLYANPQSWLDVIHPDDRDRVEELNHPLAVTRSMEFRIVRPDGEVRWLWSRRSPVTDERGGLQGVVGVVEDITERKLAEQALETSLSQLRATLDSTADGILVVNLEGGVTGYNHRFLELWKIPNIVVAQGEDEQLLSYVMDQLADPQSFLVKVKQLYADPKAQSFDVLAFRDGRVYERYSQPQRLATQIVGRVWSYRDVTTRVEAERALRQRNRRLDIQNQVMLQLTRRQIRRSSDLAAALHDITEAAAEMLGTERVGVWVLDESHSKLRVTEQFESSKHMHSAGVELARADYPAYFEAMELERSIAAEDARSDPRTAQFTESYLIPNGITSMLDAPIRAGGQLTGVVCFEHVGPARTWTVEDRTFAGSIADLVSLSLESAELQRAEDDVHFLVEASRVLASSLDYRTTLVNVARLAVPAFADWCLVTLLEDGQLKRVAMSHADPQKEALLYELERRFPISETPTSPAVRVIDSGEPELVTQLTEELLRDRTDDEGYRKIIRDAGIISYMAIPLAARGNMLGAITFVSASRNYNAQDLALGKDIASRAAVAIDNARLHERVNMASNAKSNFLAVMSHELRTPLSAITGYADLLEAGIPDPLTPRQTEQVGRIKLRAYDLLHIIEEILAFSRLEVGQERFRFEDVEIAEFTREVARVAAPLVEERGLRFRPVLPDQPGQIRTDASKARHILLDLISNAVKFTDHGEIGLEAELDNGNAVFRIRDTGMGIAPEYSEKIFEPFFQIEDPMTREKGGTGIGLSVARRLAHRLGGDLTMKSDPGKGTTFTLTIPSHPDDPSPATSPEE